MPDPDTTSPPQPPQDPPASTPTPVSSSPEPSPIPQQGRPLPILPPESLLAEHSGLTAADKALAAEGGEIIPEEFRGKALPLAPNPAVKKDAIDIPGSREVKGNAAPEPAPETPEQAAWRENLAGLINVELNIYNSCFRSVRNMVNSILATTPQDSADIGEGQWSGGKRTPIENAEPEIALEVYRQVREEMRASSSKTPALPKDPLSIIGEGLNDALVTLSGRKK